MLGRLKHDGIVRWPVVAFDDGPLCLGDPRISLIKIIGDPSNLTYHASLIRPR